MTTKQKTWLYIYLRILYFLHLKEKVAQARRHFEVLVIGAGVTGAADAHMLARYTNIQRIGVLEKYGEPAMVNSHPLNNAQTSHDGGTETNYDLAHAKLVQYKAKLLRWYVRRKGDPKLFTITKRMVLGVGEKEVALLKARYQEFKADFPDLRLIGPDEIRTTEPKLMEGRDPHEEVIALISDQGYAINYKKLAEYLLADAVETGKVETFYHTAVKKVKRENGFYVVSTNKGEFTAEVVLFASGAYSLYFAQKLGYGKEYGILSVAGDFYSAGHQVDNKVYRVQDPRRPFAEIHIDEDILDTQVSRLGPTTMPQPFLERRRWRSLWGFLQLPLIRTVAGIYSLYRITKDKDLLWYVMKNILYGLPVIGKYFFIKPARILIPTLRARDIKRRRKAGGIRPQLVNLHTHQLEMGNKKLLGEDILFDTTPSPGASICVAEGADNARTTVAFRPEKWQFDEEAFKRDFPMAA